MSGFKWLRLMIYVSTEAMKMLAKESAILVPIAGTVCLKIIFAVKMEKFFF